MIFRNIAYNQSKPSLSIPHNDSPLNEMSRKRRCYESLQSKSMPVYEKAATSGHGLKGFPGVACRRRLPLQFAAPSRYLPGLDALNIKSRIAVFERIA